jgi:hypothetical protein
MREHGFGCRAADAAGSAKMQPTSSMFDSVVYCVPRSTWATYKTAIFVGTGFLETIFQLLVRPLPMPGGTLIEYRFAILSFVTHESPGLRKYELAIKA